MSKNTNTDNTTGELMRWVGSPNDPKLEHAAEQLVDEHFDDPALTFKVAALAMTRQELTAYPCLVDLENQLYNELFSETRRANATNGELIGMAKLLHERKMATITLAQEASGSAEKPRIEGRQAGAANAGADQFNVKQRERLRRVTSAMASEIHLIASNPDNLPQALKKK
jgi:hypothetical protein